MGNPSTSLTAATAAADTDRFVVIGNGTMKNAAYTLSVTSMPEAGTARRLTLTHASVGGVADALGTVTIVGRNLAGETITEVITPLADQLANGTKWFASIASITGAGWTRNAGAGTEDTIIVGCDATAIVAEAGAGTLYGCVINTTANGTITIADGAGLSIVLPANVAVGTSYEWGVKWTAYLSVAVAAASNISVIHSGSMPATYAMS